MCGATQAPLGPGSALPGLVDKRHHPGLPPTPVIQRMRLPPPQRTSQRTSQVRIAADDYIMIAPLVTGGSLWEAIAQTGSFGRCLIKFHDNAALDTELRLRSALGIDAARVTCELLAVDITAEILVLAYADVSLEQVLADCVKQAAIRRLASSDVTSLGNAGAGDRQLKSGALFVPLLKPLAALHKRCVSLISALNRAAHGDL